MREFMTSYLGIAGDLLKFFGIITGAAYLVHTHGDIDFKKLHLLV